MLLKKKTDMIEKKIDAVLGLNDKINVSQSNIEVLKKQVDKVAAKVNEVVEKCGAGAQPLSDTGCNNELMSSIFVESANRETRKKNVTLRGLTAEAGVQDVNKGMASDEEFVMKAIRHLNESMYNENEQNKKKTNLGGKLWSHLDEGVKIDVKRLGGKAMNSNSVASHPRPLRIKFEDSKLSILFMQAFNYFKKKDKLSFYFNHVSVSIDLTPQQQKQRTIVWKELQDKIAAGEKGLMMRMDFGEFHLVQKRIYQKGMKTLGKDPLPQCP